MGSFANAQDDNCLLSFRSLCWGGSKDKDLKDSFPQEAIPMEKNTGTCDLRAIARLIQSGHVPPPSVPALFWGRCSFEQVASLVTDNDTTAHVVQRPDGRRTLHVTVVAQFEEDGPNPMAGLDDECIIPVNQRH